MNTRSFLAPGIPILAKFFGVDNHHGIRFLHNGWCSRRHLSFKRAYTFALDNTSLLVLLGDGLLTLDPAIHLGLKNRQGHRPVFQYLIVEGPDVEPVT
jgi:hypothetical protein